MRIQKNKGNLIFWETGRLQNLGSNYCQKLLDRSIVNYSNKKIIKLIERICKIEYEIKLRRSYIHINYFQRNMEARNRLSDLLQVYESGGINIKQLENELYLFLYKSWGINIPDKLPQTSLKKTKRDQYTIKSSYNIIIDDMIKRINELPDDIGLNNPF